MASRAYVPGGSLQQALLDLISACVKEWGNDPAYKDIVFKLDQAAQGLDLMCASPGHRAAMRAALPNASGQERSSHREEPQMAVQGREHY